KTVPTAWLELTIREGRNRQVRRMTAAVGLPTLRLVRVRIGDWSLDDLAPGEFAVEEIAPSKDNGAPARRLPGAHRANPRRPPGRHRRCQTRFTSPWPPSSTATATS